VISGDTSRTPNEGVTSGSLSIEQSGIALRFAAAEARELLLGAAAAKLGANVSDLTVRDGVVSTPDGKRTTYWETSTADLLQRDATAKAKPKAPGARKVIGTSVPRRDIPAKVTGGAAYVQDLRLPGMLFGRVVRPPVLSRKVDRARRDGHPHAAWRRRRGSRWRISRGRRGTRRAGDRRGQRAARCRQMLETADLPHPAPLCTST
jgi:CO/xanthine dehydrogenase Mo-binding subunit